MNRSAGSVALPRLDPPHPAASSPSAVAVASHPIAIDLVGSQRAKPSHSSHTGLPTPSSLPAQPVRSHRCVVQPPQLPSYRPSDSGGSLQVISVDGRSRSRSRSRPRASVTAAVTAAATTTTADDNGAAARPAAPTTPPSSSDESTLDDDLASLPGALFVMEDLDLELASTSSSSSSSMPHPFDRAQPPPAAPPSSGSPGARAASVTVAPRTFGRAPDGPAATYERLTGPDRSSGSTTRVSADATSPSATSSSTLSSSYPYPSPRSAPTPSAFSSNIVIRRTHRARYSPHVEPAPASMQVQVTPSRGRHPAAIPLATSDVASRPATPSISVKRAYDEVSPTTGSTPPAMPVDAEMHDANDESAAPGRSPSPCSGLDDSANMAPPPAWHTFESQRASVSGRSSTFSLDSSQTGRNSPATLRRRTPISTSISPVRPAPTVTSGHAYLDLYDEVGLDRLGISRDRSKRRRSATIPHSEGSERSTPSTSTAPATSGTAGTTFAPALGRYVPRPIPIDPVLVAEPWPVPPSVTVRGAAAASPASSTLATSSSQTMSFREELESQFSNLRPSVTLSMPSSTIPTIAARTTATDASSSEPSPRRSVGGFTRFWQAGNPTGPTPISSNASTMATSSAVTIPVTAGARDWSTTPPTLSLRTRAARSSTFPQTLPSSTAPSQVMDYRWMVDDLSSTRAHAADLPDSTTTYAREVLQRATERLERAEATMSRVFGATTPSTLEERILARRQSRLNFHLSPPAGTESSGEDTEMNLDRTTRAASEGIWASSPSVGEGSSSGGSSATAPASANSPTTTTSRTRYFLTNLRARRPRLARNSTGVPSPEVMSSERERDGWLDDLRDEGAVSTSEVSVVAPALWGEEQSQSPQHLDVAHAGAIDSAPSSMAPRRMRGPTERANERWRLGQAPVTAQTTTTNVTASASGLNTPSLVRESYRVDPRSSTTHTLGQRAAVATEGPTRTLPWRSMDFRSTITAPRTTENGTSGGDLASEIRRRYNTLREAESTIPTPVRPVDPEVTPWEDARLSDLSEDSTVSGGSTLPRPERVAPFALTPRFAPPRHRPARGLDLSLMTPSLDSGNDSREVEALEARAAAALRPSALPPMLSSGSMGRRPTHGSNETRPDDLPRFDPFGLDAVDTATGSRSNRPALLAAMRASSQLAQGTTAHRSRTSLADALTRYDAARLADEREQDDLRQRRAEEGAIDDNARRYVIEETEWEREDDDDDDPGSDVDMELWRPDVRRTFSEEVAADRSRWVRAEMEASAESEQRARQAQERLRARSEALAALRRDRGQMRHLMGNLTAPLTSGLSGPSITRTTTTTTTTSASPPTSTTTVNTASVGAARDAGDQATSRSPGTRRRGLSDFFRGVGATAHFGTSLFDDDSLLAFFGRDSVALDPRNYLADDLFDSSYDALLRLSEQLGDVVKPKGVPEDKLAALRTFKYKAWPMPERREASRSPSMTTTISTVPVASTSTSRPFGSTMVDPVLVPALARKGVEKEERCSVCLMDYDDDDECMLGMCAHGFHRECLLAWLKEHGTCP
ncbi:BQ5605_C005g03593 [Microbotryum silenes-dioicae]|uniref:BQ5605_C005g03593 protein n=1 Tax=Microbotryum silenes-dioicae TaxID=796604 RepID=A0A2X0P6X2_9BASI|nr:BQ5605_C005g03593 [Microbotryum silenes-dioicae]